MLALQSNLASTYSQLGDMEKAVRMRKDVYTGTLMVHGESGQQTLLEASNCATDLFDLRRFEEAKSLLRKNIPLARRALGENDNTTLRMRRVYARALFVDPAATLDDVREAMTTFEEILRIARRVLGGTHPATTGIEEDLRRSRARMETQPERARN